MIEIVLNRSSVEMVAFTLNTTLGNSIRTNTVVPGLNFGPFLNSAVGSHSFTLTADSVVHITEPDTVFNEPDLGNSAGFNAMGAAVWNVSVLGTIYSSVFDGVDGIGTGLLMSNGGSSGTGAGLSTITIGAEGSLFGNLFGILSNSALKIINNG